MANKDETSLFISNTVNTFSLLSEERRQFVTYPNGVWRAEPWSCVTDLTRLQSQQVLEKADLALWAFYARLHIKQRQVSVTWQSGRTST